MWAGVNLGSYPQAAAAMDELAGIDLPIKPLHRITSRIGQDRCAERTLQVEAFRAKPLAERTAPHPSADIPKLAVVMMDGGRHQRRDRFGLPPDPDSDHKTHWKENKVGLVLSMESEVFDEDPTPDFPEWLVGAKVVSEIAKLGERDEQAGANGDKQRGGEADDDGADDGENHDERAWPNAPKLLAREMIASVEEADAFAWHLEYKAWLHGACAAPRQAFVADGAATNWTIHRKHFSQMTAVLDLMHALSYADRAAKALDESGVYRRFAEWIWQGEVQRVIRELKVHQERLGQPPPDASESDPRQRIHRALTFFSNQKKRMDYPEYRRRGLPLTSSHIESAVKQINRRIKGTEKFWKRQCAEAILQLRADCLSDSQPLHAFWIRWRADLTGANQYHAIAA